MQNFFILAFFLVIAFVSSEDIFLTVAFCADEFTGKLGVVKVDFKGDFEIIKTLDLPKEYGFVGCDVEEMNPSKAFDRTNNQIILDFILDLQIEMIFDPFNAKYIEKVEPRDPTFLMGFSNMVHKQKKNELIGLAPALDGEIEDYLFKTLDLDDGIVQDLDFVKFELLQKDSHFYDEENKVFFVQGNHDMRPYEKCAQSEEDYCLIKIDSESGKTLKARWTNFTIEGLHYEMNKKGEVLGFIRNSDYCKDSQNDFLFANIHLESANAIPIACITKNVTISNEYEYRGSFSNDGKYYSTGTGNTQMMFGFGHLLIFDTKSGVALVDTRLEGLSEELGAMEKVYWLWSLDFKY